VLASRHGERLCSRWRQLAGIGERSALTCEGSEGSAREARSIVGGIGVDVARTRREVVALAPSSRGGWLGALTGLRKQSAWVPTASSRTSSFWSSVCGALGASSVAEVEEVNDQGSWSLLSTASRRASRAIRRSALARRTNSWCGISLVSWVDGRMVLLVGKISSLQGILART